MNKKVLIVLLFLVLGLSIFILYKSVAPQKSSFEKTTGRETSNSEVSENNNGQTGTGIANPASVYCVQQGGKLEIRKDAEGGEYGICILTNGRECEEWKFFRKECGAEADGPVVDIENDTKLIAQALVKKDGINLNEMNVVVREDTGKFASGGINPKEPGVGGGYFFAAKTDSGWHIVASGNGIITCAEVTPYPDFPKSMIPECVDSSGNLVRR